MRLVKYKLSKTGDFEWDFSEIDFTKKNLIVGASGTGKTRFINTIMNFLTQLTANRIMYNGIWDVEFIVNGINYQYKLTVLRKNNIEGQAYIKYEELINLNTKEVLVLRDEKSFKWKGKDQEILNNQISCFVLLQNDEIKDINKNIKFFITRRFNSDELVKAFGLTFMDPNLKKQIVDSRDLAALVTTPLDFHNRMDILKKINLTLFNKTCDLIKRAFPYIKEVQVANGKLEGFQMPIGAPGVCIVENDVKHPILVSDISSGMQKVFLFILDTILLSNNGLIIIDEYENSLGINAINFFPELIEEIGDNFQFIMTSHHPYIINNIPIKCWKVFHRKGMSVTITDGKILKEKYKHSMQDAFMQLLNDPIYINGIS